MASLEYISVVALERATTEQVLRSGEDDDDGDASAETIRDADDDGVSLIKRDN